MTMKGSVKSGARYSQQHRKKYPSVPLAKLALDRRQQEGGSHYC